MDYFTLAIIPVIILHPHCTLWLLLCSCFDSTPRYLCEWKTASLKIRGSKHTQDVFKREDASESYSRKKWPCFLYFFVEPPCVVLEWKSRFSCFLWTSLSSGIVLPLCGGSAECLYIVTTLASLIPTYFQSDPLFSIRAVIDLHLSLNLHEDEDRECSCASVRVSVCVFDFLKAYWLWHHMQMKLRV